MQILTIQAKYKSQKCRMMPEQIYSCVCQILNCVSVSSSKASIDKVWGSPPETSFHITNNDYDRDA